MQKTALIPHMAQKSHSGEARQRVPEYLNIKDGKVRLCESRKRTDSL